MKMLKITTLLTAALLTSGCATIFSGTTQTISVQAVDQGTNQPLTDISCTIADSKGMIYPVAGNPGSILVTKGNGALIPTCKKAGYVQTSFGVGDSFNGVTFVNVLFWPGFLVDAATGATSKYPSHIKIVMEKVAKK